MITRIDIFVYLTLSALVQKTLSFVTHFNKLQKFHPSPKLSSTLNMMATDSSVESILKKVQDTVPVGSIVVIKYGGHAMENSELAKFFCEDIAQLSRLGILPVIVHGGGPQIAKLLKSLSIESSFVQGLRVTDAKTMEVAQMVLCGTINKDIAGMISSQQGEYLSLHNPSCEFFTL